MCLKQNMSLALVRKAGTRKSITCTFIGASEHYSDKLVDCLADG